ncbi:LysR family transcriptional regulator [Sulfitobacter sp. F26169L]|uniref:LysR family transcriptional regulator n=1 Tax=Sulfitobacter sp. F26169L TaxID=2996015 RepID=UPI002260AD51|nr:LysR family transcriptional regulator [Sulfitobacter sp. F26169L]MCX7566705.1 LysR family transcriptional regulator [Sulfitobacter sp. F26169L]
MEWRSLPPLSALRAFAAFAHCGNVVAAGDALGVSHAAISQQLRALEAHLNVALLDRSGRALVLTDKGERLARALAGGFALIGEGVSAVTDARDARALHISVTPTFAASWLMPRLGGFRAAHPEIDLMIDPTAELVTLEPDGIDLAIRFGRGGWAGVEASILWESTMVVVGAPALFGDRTYTDLGALGGVPWIEEAGTSESTSWLRKHGLKKGAAGMLRVPGNLMLDGARDGQGIAVTVRRFVERDIEAGRLRVLHEEHAEASGYYIVTRKGVMRAPLKAFVAWLKRQAQTP